MGRKKMMKENEDRISDLPDAMIQHIISFLQSTKQVIQTSILSKRWRKQWTHVPVLIFDFLSSKLSSSKFSDEDISRICRSIDNTLILHDSSKIKKFEIEFFEYEFTKDPNYTEKLHFPIIKEAEELSLTFDYPAKNKLPEFFFNNPSLIKLLLHSCIVNPNGRVNWERLKDLCIDFSYCPTQAVENVVAGSLLLESLEIDNYTEGFDDRLIIASKSLKRLVLLALGQDYSLEISCPKLEEFRVSGCQLTCEAYKGEIENVLSGGGSPLLEFVELVYYHRFDQPLVIDSKSLKKLVLAEIESDAIVISCPNLKELHLFDLDFKTIKLLNIPSSVCATIDLNCYVLNFCNETLGRMILEQLHHVKELNVGRCFLKILSALEMRGVSFPSINRKCLTLDAGPNFVENLPGIAYSLRTSPELEKLVITLRRREASNFGTQTLNFAAIYSYYGSTSRCRAPDDFPDLNISEENYWNSKGTDFNCLVSHLKTVQIFGLSGYDRKLNLVLNFIEFLLKNARVMEKMVIALEDPRADFRSKISQKLSSFPRFSQHTLVYLLCSESPRVSEYSNHVEDS